MHVRIKFDLTKLAPLEPSIQICRKRFRGSSKTHAVYQSIQKRDGPPRETADLQTEKNPCPFAHKSLKSGNALRYFTISGGPFLPNVWILQPVSYAGGN